MSKYEVGYYSLDTGEIISEEVYKSIKSEERRNHYIALNDKYLNDPLSMSFEEIESLRKIRNKKKKIMLEYKDGFYMVGKDNREVYKNLHIETVGAIHLCGMLVNKEGCLKYRNGKPITNLEKLREELGLTDYKWRIVKKDLVKYNIISKVTIKTNNFLVLNPIYSSNSKEITYLKFLAFSEYLLNYLDNIDYLYLCKLHDILPFKSNIKDKIAQNLKLVK